MIQRLAQALLTALLTTLLVVPVGTAGARNITGVIEEHQQFNGENNFASEVRIFMPKDILYSEDPNPVRAGYTVTMQRVIDVDVTTEAGYNRAREMSVEEARELGLDSGVSGVTDQDGTVWFSNIPAGLYLIETESPADQEHVYTFPDRLAILPVADGTGGWTSTVNIHAKAEPDCPECPPEMSSRSFGWWIALLLLLKAMNIFVPPVVGFPGGSRDLGPGPEPAPTTATPDSPEPESPDPAPGSEPAETPPPPGQPQRSSLASTGASVIGLILIGIAVVLMGLGVARNGNRQTRVESN